MRYKKKVGASGVNGDKGRKEESHGHPQHFVCVCRGGGGGGGVILNTLTFITNGGGGGGGGTPMSV